MNVLLPVQRFRWQPNNMRDNHRTPLLRSPTTPHTPHQDPLGPAQLAGPTSGSPPPFLSCASCGSRFTGVNL
ncbi:uncharacterized protein B0H18DRAFT_302669 [Fomitopsis serialis]|uniref:uncharacterized protein n=1 Tax=Fomitopsis serialis TaxID=139415 RepID=UPI002007B522|nr:uncharacterized protein B0H18DRAFT_302669 [Neoantrodia serialis]KAH9926888.1 hypothetical protein B0H18DRAFT_302669 [Neoantrodia serialis]